MIINLKHLQQRKLSKIVEKPRKKVINNWKDIKKIGLIFEVGDESRWILIQRFLAAQTSQEKIVYLIGYKPHNLEISYILSTSNLIVCEEKSDFSIFGIPKADSIDKFVKQDYDLVIDTTEHPNYFGKYITANSKAALKVGYSNNEATTDEGDMRMYDMLINGNGRMDFKDYVIQIVRYLKMIVK